MTRLAELGCDPIQGMAQLAMDPASPPELRGRMYAELAQYTAPKRKAVEHEVANSQIAGFLLIGTGEAKTAEEWKREHAPKPGD